MGTAAQHRFFYLSGNDRPDFAQVLTNLLYFVGGLDEKFQVSLQVAGGNGVAVGDPLPVAFPGKVVDEGIMLLPMPVNTAVALLHSVWIPGNLKMNQTVAVVLQVNTF